MVDEDAMWAALQEDDGRRLAFGSDVWWTESGVVQKPKPEPQGEKQGEGAPEPTVTTRPANPNGCRNARRGLRKKAGLRKRAQALRALNPRVVCPGGGGGAGGVPLQAPDAHPRQRRHVPTLRRRTTSPSLPRQTVPVKHERCLTDVFAQQGRGLPNVEPARAEALLTLMRSVVVEKRWPQGANLEMGY